MVRLVNGNITIEILNDADIPFYIRAGYKLDEEPVEIPALKVEQGPLPEKAVTPEKVAEPVEKPAKKAGKAVKHG